MPFSSKPLLANLTVSGFDENDVREEDDEGLFPSWGTGIEDCVKDIVNKSDGWEVGFGVGGSIVIPSYMKSDESSFESGSGVTPSGFEMEQKCNELEKYVQYHLWKCIQNVFVYSYLRLSYSAIKVLFEQAKINLIFVQQKF